MTPATHTHLPLRPLSVLTGADEFDVLSICSMQVCDQLYGIDTRRIREVLGAKSLERVPLAPCYIGGVLPYRGDILTVVSFRALLGIPSSGLPGSILVMKSPAGEEPYGLMVDSVGGVLTLERTSLHANPPTLNQLCRVLYSGAFQTHEGLLIQLNPQHLHPSRLAESGLLRRDKLTVKEEQPCAR